jgi:short-subunit dehydrogenase
MAERKSGCIINIASRAAGVDMPKCISYGASKAAVAHATASLQEEFEQLALGEHLLAYSLHPGGVWGEMINSKPVFRSHTVPILTLKGFTTPAEQEELRPIFNEAPELPAYTVAYLAAGRAKEIRGMYFDCRHDIERVCRFGRENLKADGLNNLRMRFVPGYDNGP